MFIIITLIAFVTALTRFLPFMIFSKRVPNAVARSGKILPASLITMIFIYSCKDILLSFRDDSMRYGIIGIASILVTLLIHMLFKNFILSIVGGTCFHIAIMQRFMQCQIL